MSVRACVCVRVCLLASCVVAGEWLTEEHGLSVEELGQSSSVLGFAELAGCAVHLNGGGGGVGLSALWPPCSFPAEAP